MSSIKHLETIALYMFVILLVCLSAMYYFAPQLFMVQNVKFYDLTPHSSYVIADCFDNRQHFMPYTTSYIGEYKTHYQNGSVLFKGKWCYVIDAPTSYQGSEFKQKHLWVFILFGFLAICNILSIILGFAQKHLNNKKHN
jgi:hypothetical protein